MSSLCLPTERQPSTLATLLAGYSFEMTAKDIPDLEKAAAVIPQGTRISITFLPGEDVRARLNAAMAVRRLGFVPVPHISARRLGSQHELESFLEALAELADADHAFIIAGDLPQAAGPYGDALSVIRSGLLEKYGFRHVGISGYPEGHPGIAPDLLWRAMRDKQEELAARNLEASLITQFGFDAQPVLDWLGQVRVRGTALPAWIGVSGPASVKTLLRYAARCGVGASAKVMSKYGLSLTRVLGTAGPDPLILELAEGLETADLGPVHLHFYAFGGFARTIDWVTGFRQEHGL
ncbi:methylenetetrahydrofolate reductase [Luteimonas sp. BDR2-5]|uniref:methylenetetrahydrofolate reductase n=1 Tax=Proluteimonas luteida TaxID=2878685 RepID=UPI001E36DC9F|nr:methylenetetrahydrofolate reductase [Luteimonas sp. BDR2-5]MCD9028750.1 methylenetetrahydrofolate reductase [Luteimonas sp. BDR2-5]